MNSRRKLILALGALAASRFSFAQQRVFRVGFLSSAPGSIALAEALRQGLRELGYVDGKNILIETHFAESNPETLPKLAEELVRLKVDIIVTMFTPAAIAAKQATKTIPVVLAAAGDPVGTGLVVSLAHPGGNVTGVSNIVAELTAKNLEILREILPSMKSIAVLANAPDPFAKLFVEQTRLAAQTLNIKLQTFMLQGANDIDAVFAEMTRLRVNALIAQPSLPRQRVIDLALKNRIVAISGSSAFAEAGGLMGYSANPVQMIHTAAIYVDKILKGAKPADLPVEQPTKFELALNMKTAKTLGIKIPQSVLLRADKLIE